MGLYAEKEVLAVLGDHFVGAVGKTQLLCQALGPLRVVVRENTGFCGLTYGMGDGAPHVAAADEAKGIFHGNHSCLWSMGFPRAADLEIRRAQSGRDCFYSSIGQQGRQGRGSVGSGKFLVRIGKRGGEKNGTFLYLSPRFFWERQRYLRHKKR